MTVRLIGVALDNWRDLDGFAVSRGIPDLGTLPLGRFCNFVWWWLTRNADGAERSKLEAKLWRPPPGERVERGPWSPEAETAAFGSLKQALRQ